MRSEHGPPGNVTIGYGLGGGDPLVFSLPEGHEEDTGFFKLFVSTTYVYMSHITQPAAESATEKRKLVRRPDEFKIWGASLASITIKK